MRLFQSKPALRWLAPLALLGLISGTGLVVANTANAGSNLPPRTARQLLASVSAAKVDSLSGTVVQRSDLGLPEIPGTGGSDGSNLSSLVSGNHTMKVWFAGPDRARLQLLGRLGESDVIRNRTDLWAWSSTDNTATHRSMTAQQRKDANRQLPAQAATTPSQAAARVLAAVDPTTEVTPASNSTVAGRNAYELILRPKDTSSLIQSVHLAIDGATSIPLRVQVIAGSRTVFDVEYTSISFARPDAAQFAFNPPPGVKVTRVPAAKPGSDATKPKPGDHGSAAHRSTGDKPKIVGTGWTAVAVSKLPAGQATGQLGSVLRSLPRVSGSSWGSGRLFAGPAFSAVVTDDGRLAIGAVRPEKLYSALAR